MLAGDFIQATGREAFPPRVLEETVREEASMMLGLFACTQDFEIYVEKVNRNNRGCPLNLINVV